MGRSLKEWEEYFNNPAIKGGSEKAWAGLIECYRKKGLSEEKIRDKIISRASERIEKRRKEIMEENKK